MPREYGGLGADRVSYALAFEEIARAWLGAAGLFGPHSVACALIARHGTDEQKRRYLPAMAAGEIRSAIALTEPDAGTDLQGITTMAPLTATTTWCQGPRPGSPTPEWPACCRFS